jgi:hypothetical protein
MVVLTQGEAMIVNYAEIGRPEYNGYRFSDDGKAWSRRNRGGWGLDEEWRELKPGIMPKGYRLINISGLGTRLLHRLILEAFVGPCPEGMEGCHKDGNPANNRLDNLRWDTPKSNWEDMTKHGTDTRGFRNGAAKLTPESLDLIREMRSKGATHQSIADILGVCSYTVWRANKGITYAK